MVVNMKFWVEEEILETQAKITQTKIGRSISCFKKTVLDLEFRRESDMCVTEDKVVLIKVEIKRWIRFFLVEET